MKRKPDLLERAERAYKKWISRENVKYADVHTSYVYGWISGRLALQRDQRAKGALAVLNEIGIAKTRKARR